jgi:hypothetical protein
VRDSIVFLPILWAQGGTLEVSESPLGSLLAGSRLWRKTSELLLCPGGSGVFSLCPATPWLSQVGKVTLCAEADM